MADAPPGPRSESWPVTFEAAATRTFDAALAATPAERLAWLEEALRWSARVRSRRPADWRATSPEQTWEP